ncbi:hypothetical protein TI04_04485 [Achromatium sp. WMS2]|nr:hypothetical protein TI04_04485 [Achromatium sp. WMS2]
MAFSDFKSIADVQKRYRIIYREDKFLCGEEIPPPSHFLADLEFSKQNIDIFTSEAARSELVISPLLREIYKNHYSAYSFWIQKSIAFDEVLSGTPDYIISKRSLLGKTFLEPPIVIVVEAKRNDFEHGWGQCLAELLAAQKINDNALKPVYGIVTDANVWQFGRLISETFTRNTESFTLDNINKLYGTLEFLITLIGQDD